MNPARVWLSKLSAEFVQLPASLGDLPMDYLVGCFLRRNIV
jgi:hypothetical protein